MIEVLNVHKSYGQLKVLKGVSLEIKQGEIVSILGASGAGKTTLLQILGTLENPDKGKILYNTTDVFALNDKALSNFRNLQLGFVFQFHQLLPEFTALENICIPGFIAKKPKKEVENRALDLLNFLGIAARKDHKPAALSGGEQQRVAVARALINSPLAVLADEPSGNLDSESAENLHELFFKLRNEFNHSFVIVTHNENLAQLSDRRLMMKDGIINE